MPTEDSSMSGISRRSFLKTTAAGVAFAGSSLGFAGLGFAHGTTLRAYGVTTAQMDDPSLITKATGIKLEFTPTDADIGVFMRDALANNIGETHDIMIFDGGTQDILLGRGVSMPKSMRRTRRSSCGTGHRISGKNPTSAYSKARPTVFRSSAIAMHSLISRTQPVPIPTASTKSPTPCSMKTTGHAGASRWIVYSRSRSPAWPTSSRSMAA